MDCSQPGLSIHGVFQARVLEWGAISFSGGAPYTEGKTPTWNSAPSHVIIKAECKTCILKGNIKHSIYEHHGLIHTVKEPLEDALHYTRAQIKEGHGDPRCGVHSGQRKPQHPPG